MSDPTHSKHFNHTHNMLDMCKYNMASQENSTTQSIYSLGSEEPSITNRGLMTQHSEHTSNKRKHYMSEYRHLQMKKAEEPDYLQHPIKIVAEVQATCRSPRKLVRPKSRHLPPCTRHVSRQPSSGSLARESATT